MSYGTFSQSKMAAKHTLTAPLLQFDKKQTLTNNYLKAKSTKFRCFRFKDSVKSDGPGKRLLSQIVFEQKKKKDLSFRPVYKNSRKS